MFKKVLLATEYIVPIVDITPTSDGKDIKSGKYLGTGVFISENTILTCRHVLKSASNKTCVVGNIYKTNENLQFTGVGYTTEHKTADLATAKVRLDFAKPFRPLPVSANPNIILGQEIINYSFVEGFKEGYKMTVVPRLNRGYIMRTSAGDHSKDAFYLEISFPAPRGMSGSPILDADTGVILGIVYENYRSEILEDMDEVLEVGDKNETISERIKLFKVVEYAKAIDLSKYQDFITASIKYKQNEV